MAFVSQIAIYFGPISNVREGTSIKDQLETQKGSNSRWCSVHCVNIGNAIAYDILPLTEDV